MAVHVNAEKVGTVLNADLRAVDPAAAVRRQVSRQGDALVVPGRTYNLAAYRHVCVVGGGKASVPMATALSAILGDRVTAGHINTRRAGRPPAAGKPRDMTPLAPRSPITLTLVGHRLPDEYGEADMERMADLLRAATAEDLVLFVISGGGSALTTWPLPGISQQQKREVTRQLLGSGATSMR